MHVAVLGCGPSGLMAAHACREQGHAVTIISVKQKSEILGGQYLHIEVPGITGKPDTVTYIKIGNAEGYSQKVYGKPDVPCFRFPDGEYPAWSMTEAYDNLWGIWGSLIKDVEVEPGDIHDICQQYDLVFCTLPRNKMCYKTDHRFDHQSIILDQDQSFLNPVVSNVVLYSGRPQDLWYRTSNLFGHRTTEWSPASMPEKALIEFAADLEIGDCAKGFKPLNTDCDCHDENDNFVRLGRFGVWRHGVLVSDAWEEARKELEARA
jgi:hypothetical protein